MQAVGAYWSVELYSSEGIMTTSFMPRYDTLKSDSNFCLYEIPWYDFDLSGNE